MPVRALIAAGGLFDLDENRIRVAIARMLVEGSVERDQRGAYRLQSAHGVPALVTGWRRIEDRVTRWDGRWLVVLGGGTPRPPREDRASRRAGERALRMLGFQSMERDVAIRPANFVESVSVTRTRLVELGLPVGRAIGVLDDLDEAARRRACSLWDAGALRRDYTRAIARLESSGKRLARMTEARAMVESFTLGGHVIRQIVLDPLLPPPLVPAGELAALVRAMRAYDIAGRACWRSFLERHGVDFARAPAPYGAHDAGRAEQFLGGTT